MAVFAHDKVLPDEKSNEDKKNQVAAMFDSIARRYDFLNPDKIVGIDISEGMLELGRNKIKKLNLENKIELFAGDSETINHQNSSFDAITVAFGVRNFAHLEKGLTEMLRVLKPGGKIS